MKNTGFIGVGPEQGTYVSGEDAYAYALERIQMSDEEEKNEFLEWFYSGNWISEEVWSEQ